MSQEFMPAPHTRGTISPESLAVAQHKETPLLPENGEHYSQRFLGTLLTPDLNPDTKIATLLTKPTAAYKAIEMLWSDQREKVANDQLNEKIKLWADARAETHIDVLIAPKKDIFASLLGFTFDETLSRDGQVAKFSEYLQGPFYEKYCGENGIQNLAEVLSTMDVRGLHDFLAPILGGEDQYQRLEACQLALYRNSGRSRHPLTPDTANSDSISSDEERLLTPMRDKLLVHVEKEDTLESLPAVPTGSLSLLEAGEAYPLAEILAFKTGDKIGPELDKQNHPVISIEQAQADAELMDAMIAHRPLQVIVVDQEGTHQNPAILSLNAASEAPQYGITAHEHSYIFANCVNGLIAAAETHPELWGPFFDMQKRIDGIENPTEANYVVTQLQEAYKLLQENYTNFSPRRAFDDYNDFLDVQEELELLRQINQKAGRLQEGERLPLESQNLLPLADLTDVMLKELAKNGTSVTRQQYESLLAAYPDLVAQRDEILPMLKLAVSATRDTTQQEHERFSLGLQMNGDHSIEVDKEFTLQEIFPARIRALQESSKTGTYTLGQLDFAELLSDIYDIRPVIKRIRNEELDTLEETIPVDTQERIAVGQPHLVSLAENSSSLPIQEVVEMQIGQGSMHIMHGDITHTPAEALVYQTNRKFEKIEEHDSRPDIRKQQQQENQWLANDSIAVAAGATPFEQAHQYFNTHGKNLGNRYTPFIPWKGMKSLKFGTAEVFDSGNLKERNIQKLLFSFIADDKETREGFREQSLLHDIPATGKVIKYALQQIFSTADTNDITSLGMPIIGLSFLGYTEMDYTNVISLIGAAYKEYQRQQITQGHEAKLKDIYLVVNETVADDRINGSLSIMQDVFENLQK